MALMALLVCVLIGTWLSLKLGDLDGPYAEDFLRAHRVPLILANLGLAFWAVVSLWLMVRATFMVVRSGDVEKFTSGAAMLCIWIVPLFSIHLFLYSGLKHVAAPEDSETTVHD